MTAVDPGPGTLWPVRAAALLSLPPIAALCGAVESRNLALFLGLVFSLPWLSLLVLLAFPRRRVLTARGLELAVIVGVVGTGVFAVLALPPLLRGHLPALASAVCWSFPVAQAGLVVAARRAQRALPGPPLPAGARVLAAVVLFVVPLALDSPLLMGAHPHGAWWTNESRARSEVREMVAAQHLYQAATSGAFGSLECLSASPRTAAGEAIPEAGAGAIPGCAPLPPGRTFLREALASPVRGGYRFELHLATGPDGRPAFAYTAVPLRTGGYPGWVRTGGRSFCGDSTGRICSVGDGTPPALEAGLCAASCATID